jgi:hypothetical protein
MKNVAFIVLGSLWIGMLLVASSPAEEYSIREAVDIARRVPEIPATTGDMTIREAVDRGRALSYENGVAQGYYPAAGQEYSIREAVDLFGYRAPAAWPFGYPQPYPQYAAAAYYQMPYYTAPYYAGNTRILSVEELFGTPRQTSAPVEIPPQIEPPPPVITAAAEPAIIRPATVQAGVIATRPVAVSDTAPDALPELTLLDMVAYWTRKIVVTGLLLIIIGFAVYKKRTAEHSTSRRITDLEDELQRLDRIIYGEERKGGHTL